MSLNPLSNGTFPNDLLCYVFQQTEPNVKELIIWSLVNKQFRDCSLDISLWRPLADKHAVTGYTTGQQIKEALIAAVRIAFNRKPPWIETWCKTPTPLFCYDVHTRYASCSPSLLEKDPSRFAHSSGESFPITRHGKTYSIKSTQCYSQSHYKLSLEIKTPSSMVRDIIPLAGVSDPFPKGELNGDVLILQEQIGYSSYLKLLYLGLAPIGSEPYFFCSEYQNPVKWELFRGSIVYTIYRRPKDNPLGILSDCDDVRYINYALKPLVAALEKLKEIDQKQICLLRGLVSNTAEIPPQFLCPISCIIMSNPVRDKCVPKGDVFEKEAILQFLSEGTAAEVAYCPLSKQVMPGITKECDFLYIGENEAAVVNINNGLTGDVDLQREILAWLQNQVGANKKNEIADLFEDCMNNFMQAFSLVPCSYKHEVYGHLRDIQNPANAYDLIGVHAFHGLYGQSSTREEKMEALRRCIHAAEIEALEWMF